MTFADSPSIVKYSVLCAALAGMLAAEIGYIHSAKTNGKNFANRAENLIREIDALGPLAASKEDLAACEASFGDNFKNGQLINSSTFSGKARMTMELARLLSMNGLEEGAASTAASTLSNIPEAVHAVTLIAKSEGLRLRSIESNATTDKSGWIIDATCDKTTFSELLATLGRISSGIALDAIDMRCNGDKGIDLRLELTLPKKVTASL